MAFTVGQKVVCVDMSDLPPAAFQVPALPKVGSVYVIRELHKEFLRLEEFIYPKMEGILGGDWVTAEPAFNAYRFRPIVERKTEISFTTGADPESEKWDNRKAVPAYSFDVTEHESILQYLRGFY